MLDWLKQIGQLFNYSVFDKFVEQGAQRLDTFPSSPKWEVKAQKFYVDNLTLNDGSRGGVWVAGESESIVIADWKKQNAVRIYVRDLSSSPDVEHHRSRLKRSWNKYNRPYLFGEIKVGFGTQADQFIAQHIDYRG